jgi:hypothetical protein
MFASPARSVSSSSCLASSARLSLHLLQSADTSAAAAWFPEDLTPPAQLATNVLHRWGWDVCSGVQVCDAEGPADVTEMTDVTDMTDSTDSSDCWTTAVHFDNTDGSFCSLSPTHDDRDMLQVLAMALEAAGEEEATNAAMEDDDDVVFVSCTRDPLAADVQFVGMCLCDSKRRSRRDKCLLHSA